MLTEAAGKESFGTSASVASSGNTLDASNHPSWPANRLTNLPVYCVQFQTGACVKNKPGVDTKEYVQVLASIPLP